MTLTSFNSINSLNSSGSSPSDSFDSFDASYASRPSSPQIPVYGPRPMEWRDSPREMSDRQRQSPREVWGVRDSRDPGAHGAMEGFLHGGHENALLLAADFAFDLIALIRGVRQATPDLSGQGAESAHQDLASIRVRVHEGLLNMEVLGAQKPYASEIIKSAQYVLCSFLDEVLMASPWALDNGFRVDTFLSHYFQETWGGERVFWIRQYCLEGLEKRLDLFELIYVTLCLGFQGKYAIQSEGGVQLSKLKQESYRVIREFRGAPVPSSEWVDRSERSAVSGYGVPFSLKRWAWWWVGVMCVGYLGVSCVFWAMSRPLNHSAQDLVATLPASEGGV
jgi:type IV/VI secretion system ImpK/VasF family protein